MTRLLTLPAIVCLWLLSACVSVPPQEAQSSRPAARSLAAPEDEAVFHFIIYGDRTSGPRDGVKILAKAVEETNLLAPDLVMTVGDLVQGYNETDAWLKQAEEYRGIMNELRMPWYPVAGNHDIYWRGSAAPPGHHEANYETNFGPLWYWFGHKNAAFIVLYTDEGDPDSNRKGTEAPALVQMSAAQVAWLQETLARTAGYDHVFLFMHHPRWAGGAYKESNWDQVHEMLVDAGNVTAVFAGHLHRQRYSGRRDDIEYFVLAGIGAYMAADEPGTGWLNHMEMVSVREDRVDIATIPVGAVYDPRLMTVDYLKEIDKAMDLPVTRLSAPLELSRRGAAQGKIRYEIQNTVQVPVKVTATVTAPLEDWQIEQDRETLELVAGESGELSVALTRDTALASAAFSVPRVSLQVDYLAERGPVALPADRWLADLLPPSGGKPPEPAATNKALFLDGAGAAVMLPSDLMALPQGPLTFEAWFRADSIAGNRAIIGKSEASEYILAIYGGRPVFLFHSDGRFRPAVAGEDVRIEPGRWYHMAGVYDGTAVRLYLDGALIAQSEVPGARTVNDLPFFVGAEPNDRGGPNFLFHGAIDELRISTAARYSGESFQPQARHSADADTFLLWHMDGQGLPFVTDARGERHGLPLRGARFVPSMVDTLF